MFLDRSRYSINDYCLLICLDVHWLNLDAYGIDLDVQWIDLVYRYTHFYTAANVHSAIKQFLQIIHTSLAIEKFFM